MNPARLEELERLRVEDGLVESQAEELRLLRIQARRERVEPPPPRPPPSPPPRPRTLATARRQRVLEALRAHPEGLDAASLADLLDISENQARCDISGLRVLGYRVGCVRRPGVPGVFTLLSSVPS